MIDRSLCKGRMVRYGLCVVFVGALAHYSTEVYEVEMDGREIKMSSLNEIKVRPASSVDVERQKEPMCASSTRRNLGSQNRGSRKRIIPGRGRVDLLRIWE